MVSRGGAGREAERLEAVRLRGSEIRGSEFGRQRSWGSELRGNAAQIRFIQGVRV